MAGQYTEAQKRAILKYQKKFKHVTLALTEEEYQKYLELAEKEDTSLRKLIGKLLEEEYTKKFAAIGSDEVEIQSNVSNRIILDDRQIEAIAYARQLYLEFASYLDFLWDWNWKSEGILTSLDRPGKQGAINRKLASAGFSEIKGIEIDPDALPKDNINISRNERKERHDEYLDIVLDIKKNMIKYFRKVDELCGTNFFEEMY